ncbi:MAG: WecB/TagA/CpsF family glycosyltransferase [Dehalococcoidia bacterium]|nr:WecB/TagA/CpsF family glycosyltransferase [Dehalococcoidia bacterium]
MRLLGIRIDNLPRERALARLAAFAASGKPHHIVTVNPEFLIQAQETSEFAGVLNGADLALADGAGLALGARVLGRRLADRVPGVDLIDQLAAHAAAAHQSMFLLGAAPGVADAAAAVLILRHSGLIIAGAWAGSPSAAEENEIVGRIVAARPHYLFVAFGSPQQDLWIHRNLHRLQVPVCMGVGGAFDFLSGRVPRAPRWMRSAGLEWAYRLGREPWRWRRMLRLPRFLFLVVRQRIEGPAA